MKNLITASALVLVIASGPAFAQMTAPKTTPSTAPAAAMDPAAEAKFKAADKDNNGTLSGAEVTPYKSDMSKIDANKDGNVSRDEFASAVKAGVIK